VAVLRTEVDDLIAELRGALDADAGSESLAGLLAEPVLIVVPSRSLREHLSQALTGVGAVLGLRVLTLEGLVTEALRRAGEPCVDSPLHAVLARRLASREPTLATPLDPYDDGYQVVAGAVDDLLDAGLEPAHAEFLLERIEELEGGIPAARVAAVTRVAIAMAERPTGVACHRAERVARARRAIESDPELVLPARRILLAGFQDATGVQSDLIETLMRTGRCRIFLEHPLDPVLKGPGEFGRFGERLRERIAGFGDLAVDEREAASHIEVVRAPDRESEVRDLAAALRGLIDDGVTPERIGVVARDLAPYRTALRRQLARVALPFSGCGEPGLGGPARARLDALQDLLDQRERCSTDRWLDALGGFVSSGPGPARPLSLQRAARIRRALHRRGRVQLRDLAGLRHGSGELGHAVRAAQVLTSALEGLAPTRSLALHGAALRELLIDVLGWEDTTGAKALAEVEALLTSPAFEASADETLRFDEFLAVVRRGLSSAARGRLGGRGGGVQVLGVMEARSRSFDVLFVLGLNRGLFPRPVNDDPFLPDALRARLRDVLPEMPVKAEGHDEERFLFAQLLSAAPRVVLSCPRHDEEGRPLAPSPLLERLVGAEVVDALREAEPLHAALAGDRPRPAYEHALLAALRGGHRSAQSLLRFALGGSAPDVLADARSRVVREFDAYRGPGGELGPYFGFVGPRDGLGAPSVTHVEQVLRCPWSAFLRRELGLRPVPDALDGLPRVDEEYMLLGNVVHGALDRIVAEQLPAPLASDAEPASHRVVWPPDAVVARVLREAAEEELERAEISLPGYARVLARRAAPFVDVARQVDWSEGAVDVVGVERDGEALLSIGGGETRALRFRADRVDRVGGGLRITDYKTGKTKIKKKDDAASLLESAADRRLLQAVVYAASARGAEGRYLFLKPDDDGCREGRVVVGAEGLPQRLEAALAAVFDAYEEGALIPRLRLAREDTENSECRRCDVKEACLRGDSGARGRLARFMEGRDPLQGSRALRAATALWQLEGSK
jgi:RecB family exonuclease